MSEAKNRTIFRRILVPVTGTEADDETMRMACWIAKRDKSKLYAMYVITIKRSLPLEAEIESETRKAEELLDRMERIAEAEDYTVETDLLQAREVAPTIIDEAVERKVDLIIMGVKYQRRFGQFSLGNIVPYILKNATCQVMLYSQYTG
ncbi:MAG: universal stress protein [Dehalococcoidales bacterium]|jgi:nucleotide-binding universal stress UspA family protein|nr:universal stress protein [Dehalococcoidales bacterium]